MARTGRPTKEEQRKRKAESVPNRLLYSTKEACLLLNCGAKFLREQIESTLDFIGSCSVDDDILLVASKIRATLQIDKNFKENILKGDMLKFLKSKINNIGVFVFFNGVVGENTRRALSLAEFRGFVLVDNKAPIIFINQKDETINGKVFTLVHELVHLFVGSDEILTEVDARDYTSDKTEAFVNEVTAEILVPNDIFRTAVEELRNSSNNNIVQMLAEKFKVSEFVIVRRLYDFKFIDRQNYLSKTKELTDRFEQFQKNKPKSSSGGDYYNNLRFKVDRRFFGYVQEALQQNRISYTEAFRIIGVGLKGYKALAEA